MKTGKQVVFSPFRLDVVNRRLYRGDVVISLRPKSWTVLHYLIAHAGRCVTKDELLDAVWPETAVSDTVLKVCIGELREALGDDPKQPRFIETAHRFGYRFVAETATDTLPADLTSFIGRAREIAEAEHLLRESRLLTLTGAGGSGKTRLAAHVARQVAGDFEDGACWVELAPVSAAAGVAQTLAAALRVREQPGRPLTATLAADLRRKHVLVVLDNCEHLVDACAALVSELLQTCPRLKVLATSREPLGAGGEVTWTVPPLSLPDMEHRPRAEEIAVVESVRLFLERAWASVPEFAVTEGNASAVAQICHRLDGMPLAIELAAARVRVLSVDQIAARLDDCFHLLTGGARTELPRHQTLRAAIDWSYDLLTDNERDLLRRLSVFAGGWTLAAAEGICAGDRVAEAEILDLLSHLVDKSLVTVGERTSGIRYRLLETVRQYARAELERAGAAAAVRDRHAVYFRRFAETIEPRINTSQRADELARLDRERDNLRAALHWALEARDAETGLRVAAALFWFWLHRGHWNEGRGWFKDVLALPRVPRHAHSRAKALYGDGVLAWASGDLEAARQELTESVTLFRELGDTLALAHALHFLGSAVAGAGDHRSAWPLCEESVAIFRGQDDPFGLAVSLASLGIVRIGMGEYETARTLLDESVAQSRAIGDRWALSLPLRNLGIVALRQGDYQGASALLKESLAILQETQEKWFISRSLETLAGVTALAGDHECAARLFGAGEALREVVGASVLSFYRADYDRGVAAARAGLAPTDFDRAWAEGRALTWDQAIRYALS